MNCQEFARVLDDRCHVDAAIGTAMEAHAHSCSDCTSALTAHEALQAEFVPAAYADTDALLQSIAPAATAIPERRKGSRLWPIAIGAFVTGSLVFAALTVPSWLEQHAKPPLVQSDTIDTRPMEPDDLGNPADQVSTDSGNSMAARVEAEEREAQRLFAQRLVESRILPDGEYFSLLIVPPAYPAEAVANRLEGSVVVEFTISEKGFVEDVSIIQSDNSIFDRAAINAVQRFKYKPRVTNGRPVSVAGIRNKLTFVFQPPAIPNDDGMDDPILNAPAPDNAEQEAHNRKFRSALARASSCLETEDLTCIELELETIGATLELEDTQRAEVWRYYGFIHHRRQNFEAAIDAYQRSVALSARSPNAGFYARALITIARIHYQQARYQEALDAAVEYLKAVRQANPEDYVFVDHLRALGATVR